VPGERRDLALQPRQGQLLQISRLDEHTFVSYEARRTDRPLSPP
jgi:hypothetical protein